MRTEEATGLVPRLAIFYAALFVLPFDRVLYSIAGALVLNFIIAFNHKPGRYVGFS